ncbi:hypothetical protein BKA66DRAFT_577010 [Pyrenochaeta sp. MPI-SDFR-AT-0127]|nr:hypothetical protein BKA66DRAFT_577010 [Pyrenochaeta sp. MPI-SDFR-AT-0127]
MATSGKMSEKTTADCLPRARRDAVLPYLYAYSATTSRVPLYIPSLHCLSTPFLGALFIMAQNIHTRHQASPAAGRPRQRRTRDVIHVAREPPGPYASPPPPYDALGSFSQDQADAPYGKEDDERKTGHETHCPIGIKLLLVVAIVVACGLLLLVCGSLWSTDNSSAVVGVFDAVEGMEWWWADGEGVSETDTAS